MLKSLKTVSWACVFAGCICALCESDWRLSLVLLAAGFAGLIYYGVAQGSIDNDRYRIAVVNSRPLDSNGSDSNGAGSSEQVPTTSPFVGLLFLVCFFSIAFLSVYFNSPWPCVVAVSCSLTIGIPWAIQRTTRRNAAWQSFASQNDWTFDRGSLWDYQKNGCITFEHDGRRGRLKTAWQDQGTRLNRRKRFEVLIAEISTTIAHRSFTIDELRLPDSTPDLARHLFDLRDLAQRIEVTAPSRISLFEKSLTFHFLRIPVTELELTFYIRFLTDAAYTLERFEGPSL